MEWIKIILLAIVIVGIAFVGLGINIVTSKKRKFPNIHIGSNPNMQKRGISCAQTFDKIEQAKAKRELRFKELSLSEDND